MKTFEFISEAVVLLKNAITPSQSGYDANGGFVTSLTEAVMGITGGLIAINKSIQNHVDHSSIASANSDAGDKIADALNNVAESLDRIASAINNKNA